MLSFYVFCSSRRRNTGWPRDWSSDVCSADLEGRVVSDLFDEALLADEPAQPASPRVARRDRAERRRKRRRRTAIAVTVSLLLVVGLVVVAYQLIRPFFDGSGEEELADYPGPGSGQVTVLDRKSVV